MSFINEELKQKWGWNEQQAQTHDPQLVGYPQNENVAYQQQQQYQQHHQQHHHPQHGLQPSPNMQQLHQQSNMQPTSLPPSLPAAAQQQPQQQQQQMRRPPSGIVNPIFATADFNMPQHPYQAHYVAPNPPHYSQNSLADLAHQATYY